MQCRPPCTPPAAHPFIRCLPRGPLPACQAPPHTQHAHLHSGTVGHSLVGVDGLAQLLAVEEVLRQRREASGSGRVTSRWWLGLAQGSTCRGRRSALAQRDAGQRALCPTPFLVIPSPSLTQPRPPRALTCSSCCTLGMRVEPPTSTTSFTVPLSILASRSTCVQEEKARSRDRSATVSRGSRRDTRGER